MYTVTVRLYSTYDMDLIHLASYQDFSLIKVAKQCLSAYANGEAFRIAHPTGKNTPELINKTSYVYTFTLDLKEDKAAISLLRKIKKRQMNAFIKTLIRGYMAAPFLEAFFTEQSIAREKNEVFIDSIKYDSIIKPLPKNKPAIRQIKMTGTEKKAAIPKAPKKKKTITDTFGDILLTKRAGENDILTDMPLEKNIGTKVSENPASSVIMENEEPKISITAAERTPTYPQPAVSQQIEQFPVKQEASEPAGSVDPFDLLESMVVNY